MGRLAHDYVLSVWKQRSVNALYPPKGTVRLGDVLRYDNGVYASQTSLNKLGIDAQTRRNVDPRPDTINSWSVKSEHGVDVQAKLKGKLPTGVTLSALTQSSAGAVVTMKDANSFLLAMSDIQMSTWANPEALNGFIRHLFWRNQWNTSWIVVTEIWRAKHCTFLASAKENAQFELRAKTGVTVSAVNVDVSAGMAIVNTTSDQDNFADADGTVPIFRGYRWLLGMRPSGRKATLFKYASLATVESLKAEPFSTFGDVVPVRFDPEFG